MWHVIALTMKNQPLRQEKSLMVTVVSSFIAQEMTSSQRPEECEACGEKLKQVVLPLPRFPRIASSFLTLPVCGS